MTPVFKLNAKVCLGWAQTTTGGGARSSSATAYLHPNLNRPNLDVLIGTQVTRLLTADSNTTTSTPDLRTVEYAQSATGSFSYQKDNSTFSSVQVPV